MQKAVEAAGFPNAVQESFATALSSVLGNI